MAGEPILIVDDNPINLKLIRVLLTAEGYDVRTAADGSEMMEMLKYFLPRLILMDIQLPGRDGIDLTRQLKADSGTKDVIILALTAYAMKGDNKKALDAGCDGYITKPIDADTLPTLVAEYLKRK